MTLKLPRPLWFAIPTGLLVVVVVLLKVGLPAHRQQAAIRLIQKLEGDLDSTPRGPEWLRELLGDERMQFFDAVTLVALGQTDVTDADLALICEAKTIEDVAIADTRITDAGLKYLAGLPRLRSLILSETKITDDGILHLKHLSKLEVLHLERTHITDGSLKELRRMKSLKWLYIGGTDVTETGVAELERERPDMTVFQEETSLPGEI
jgi:hypothetical protein